MNVRYNRTQISHFVVLSSFRILTYLRIWLFGTALPLLPGELPIKIRADLIRL
jgi:hypothetical protein